MWQNVSVLPQAQTGVKLQIADYKITNSPGFMR
jgi:hypothetical protein